MKPTNQQKAIKNRWIYKIKRLLNGEIAKYKIRLVAKGFPEVWS